LRTRKRNLLDAIRTLGKLDDDSEKQIVAALTEFAKTFSVEESKT
jgi:hypothetical protein